MGISLNKKNREGVALILVVGMLALLMVMGVSFAVFMRTERIAAGNFRNDVQARQLLHVALARAMGDIEFRASVSNAHYPEWSVLISSNAAGNVVSNSAWATNYIPWGAVDASLDNVSWIDVGQAGCSGRIAYACINASGLLDINYAGAGTRASGTNASEIQISVLPDVQNAAALVSSRSIKPYETLQEVNALGVAGLNGAASSFVTYSANPKTYANGAIEPWVDIGGDTNALIAKHGAIVVAFQDCVPDGNAEFLYNNLLDYVDADHVPSDLASACTESVPMINEVEIRNRVRFYPTGVYSNTVELRVEWFYPFVKPRTEAYWLTCDATFQAVSGTASIGLPATVVNQSVDSGYVSGNVEKYNSALIRMPALGGVYTNDLGRPCAFIANVKMVMREGSSSGPVVDAAPYPVSGAALVINSTTCNVPASVSLANGESIAGAETVDSRFNWDCANRAQWRPYGRGLNGSMNLINTNALIEMGRRYTDGYTSMYVADGPLGSPAELSFLVRSSVAGPDGWWRTIRLLDDTNVGEFKGADPILDYFVVNSTNNIRVGCVNPNTRSESVMKSLLRGLPLEKFPGEGVSGLDDTTAGNLAQWWVSADNVVQGSISNLSQIGRMTNVFSDASFPPGKLPFEKEAFFRNLVGLLGVRQNYFVILLYAQAIKVTPDGQQNASAECRAVAEVWRDARPNAEGRHPCKVRLLKILPNP